MTRDYFRFTAKSRLEKAINTLLGMFEGIAIDGKINSEETTYLVSWLSEYQEYAQNHPFDEILPIIANAIHLGIIPQEERDDITWLCEKFRSGEYFNDITHNLQRLHAILAGIAADGIVTEQELSGLADWISDHDYLRKCWPYDEIDSLITSVLADHKIDPEEHSLLLHFFSEFTNTKPVDDFHQAEHSGIQGLCSVSPSIDFDNSVFCFTGEASQPREELEIQVIDRGGDVSRTVTKKVQYLVIGGEGNPCWAYACYGRKVEQAVKLRKQGHTIVLVHELDFLDAIA